MTEEETDDTHASGYGHYKRGELNNRNHSDYESDCNGNLGKEYWSRFSDYENCEKKEELAYFNAVAGSKLIKDQTYEAQYQYRYIDPNASQPSLRFGTSRPANNRGYNRGGNRPATQRLLLYKT